MSYFLDVDIQSIVKILERDVRGAKKSVFVGAGHMVNMERSEDFNRVLRGFLANPAGQGK